MEFNQEEDSESAGDFETKQVKNQDEEQSDDSDSYQLMRDRARRISKPTQRYGYADLISHSLSTFLEKTESEPETYHEAMKNRDKEKWLQAIRDEMNSLKKNGTWILVKQPENQKLVGCKWIFKIKECISGVELLRYKARLVAKGFT